MMWNLSSASHSEDQHAAQLQTKADSQICAEVPSEENRLVGRHDDGCHHHQEEHEAAVHVGADHGVLRYHVRAWMRERCTRKLEGGSTAITFSISNDADVCVCRRDEMSRINLVVLTEGTRADTGRNFQRRTTQACKYARTNRRRTAHHTPVSAREDTLRNDAHSRHGVTCYMSVLKQDGEPQNDNTCMRRQQERVLVVMSMKEEVPTYPTSSTRRCLLTVRQQ